MLAKYIYIFCSKCPVLQSGLRHIYVMLYFYTCSLYHYFYGILPLMGHVNRELKLSVNQQFDVLKNKIVTLPLWARAMLRFIKFPTSQDFSGICGGVWMVNFCNNKAILVWLTEAATFPGTVWLIYSVNVTEIMFEKGLKTHTEPGVSAIRWWKGALSFRRNVEGTWAEDCRSCLWCCLKTWPIPLTMISDRGLDEYYWGHHRVMKRNVYQKDSTIHVPSLFSSFSTMLNKCFIIF